MESKNAGFLRQGLIDRYRKMTPAQRVDAFLEHSKLMAEFRKAGEQQRKAKRAEAPSQNRDSLND